MKIKKEILLLILILIIASFLRLFYIADTEFKADQALNMYLGLDLIENNFITQRILISSVGTYNPPPFHYLLSLPLMITKNPIFVSCFIALLNILAVLMCYLLVKKIATTKTAFLASALYAVNPWVILYSRHIWHQNALPFFVLLFIYGLVVLVKEKKSAFIILSSFALAFILQLHLSTLLLSFVLLAAVIWQRKNIKLFHLILAILIFLSVFLPYFIFETTHDFYNLNQFEQLSKLPFKIHGSALIIPFKLTTTFGLENYFLAELPLFLKHPFILKLIDLVYLILLLAAFIYVLFKIKKQKELIIIVLWFCLPVLFLLFNKSDIYNHYFIVTFPAQFIMLAILINSLIKKINFKKNISILIFCLLIVLICYQLIYSIVLLEEIKKQKCFKGEYGPSLTYQMKQVKKLLDANETEPQIIYTSTCSCSLFCHPFAVNYLIDYYNDEL